MSASGASVRKKKGETIPRVGCRPLISAGAAMGWFQWLFAKNTHLSWPPGDPA
jgi:hypothetical protein